MNYSCPIAEARKHRGREDGRKSVRVLVRERKNEEAFTLLLWRTVKLCTLAFQLKACHVTPCEERITTSMLRTSQDACIEDVVLL